MSNHVGAVGVEPTQPVAPDLQSGALAVEQRSHIKFNTKNSIQKYYKFI